jgi:putative restriction endonuclease
LKNQVDENAFQEEIFIRGGLFKREIPKIYNHTCAVSGLRISAVANVSMVDACHIVPFSEGYDDTLTNGIALCPNLHRAFDRGLISISDDYKILVNRNFVENQKSAFNLTQFAEKQIFLPYAEELYPDLGNIAVHRKKFGFLR